MSKPRPSKSIWRPPEPLKDLIRRGRLNRRMSVGEAAERCGISAQLLRNYEAGRQGPPIDRLERIAEVVGVDVLELLRSWSAEKLEGDRSPVLRELLTTFTPGGERRRPSERKPLDAQEESCGDEIPPVRELIDAAYLMPMDRHTSHLAYRMIERVAEYRKKLTEGHGNHNDLRAEAPPDDDDQYWSKIDADGRIRERRLGLASDGIGFLCTFVWIAPGAGGYHRQVETRFTDAGFEYFSVVRGSGWAYFDDPAHKLERPQWKEYPLEPGISGYHRSGRGHAFVNTGGEPMVLFVTVVPYPAQLQYRRAFGDRRPLMEERAVFDLQSLAEAKGAPDKLVRMIRARVGSGTR